MWAYLNDTISIIEMKYDVWQLIELVNQIAIVREFIKIKKIKYYQSILFLINSLLI